MSEPAPKFELINVTMLPVQERASVLMALLALLQLRAYRVTKSDGSQYFGVMSELDVRTSVPAITWAEGHR
jgi:hypothetical protein